MFLRHIRWTRNNLELRKTSGKTLFLKKGVQTRRKTHHTRKTRWIKKHKNVESNNIIFLKQNNKETNNKNKHMI